jgi:ribosomal protein L29
MKYHDLNQKTDKELADMLQQSRTKLSDLVIDMRTKQVSNVKQIAAAKKTVARILTLQNDRELTKLEESNG